jgi:hypothetical protein
VPEHAAAVLRQILLHRLEGGEGEHGCRADGVRVQLNRLIVAMIPAVPLSTSLSFRVVDSARDSGAALSADWSVRVLEVEADLEGEPFGVRKRTGWFAG